MTAPTITPTITATVPVVARATSPIHHGAGTSGNTQILRVEDFIAPDGTPTRTPFVSGNSLRHAIRAAIAWDLAETIGIADGSITKACVDLLWSGGALSQPGAQTDLAAMRERHALLPHLRLLGYAHGPDIVSGTLRVSHAHLWCTENAWRLPNLTEDTAGPLVPAAEWIDEAFGTRHDVAGTAVDRLLDGVAAPTNQMIYDFQVVRSGSVWAWAIHVDAATQPEVDALTAALTRITRGGRWQLAAKAATGYGDTLVETLDLTELTPDPAAAVARYHDHLIGHADAIRALLAGL